MDVARVVLALGRAYTVGLLVLALVTVGWLVNPSLGQSPTVAGLWFAVAAFGLLVGSTILLVHASR